MRAVEFAERLPAAVLIGAVRLYQLTLSPFFRGSCRFEPGCSQYFVESVKKYGALTGAGRGVRRVFRCHPWSRGGYDPP